MRHLAIIGGGFSGAVTLIQLLRHADTKPTTIHWYHELSDWGRGLAYSTRDMHHLLNVRADRMGAFPDAIDDFYHWLQLCYPNRFSGADYVPRMIYGDYLQTRLHESLEHLPDCWSIHRINERVVSATPIASGFELITQNARQVQIEKMVLACGNEAYSVPNFIRESDRNHPRLICNPWYPRETSLLHPASRATAQHVVLIGSGLTAVDIALSLLNRDADVRVTMLSRHGLLSAAHSDYLDDPLQPIPPALPALLPETVLEMWRFLKQSVRAYRGDWRAVIDSVRKDTPAWWHALPEHEKRRAMRHAVSHWNRWRHRMSDTIATQLTAYQAQGRLQLQASRIQSAQYDGTKWQIQTHHTTLAADELVLCMGFAGKLNQTHNPLLQSLLMQHIIQPGPLGLGIATDDNSIVNGRIMPMGALLLGEWFESVAVPELRVQAHKAAQFLLAA